MDRRSTDRATDCIRGSTDWTSIGARILQAASIASAVHLHEQAQAAACGGRQSSGTEARDAAVATRLPRLAGETQ
jgi:hypothetical protein